VTETRVSLIELFNLCEEYLRVSAAKNLKPQKSQLPGCLGTLSYNHMIGNHHFLCLGSAASEDIWSKNLVDGKSRQLFGASASFLYRLATAPLSKGITTWFPQKNHPSAMFS